MIHMLDIGIGIDGGIGLYCRKQHLDSFGNSWSYCVTVFFGAVGASVGLLLLWTRKVVEKFDGAVGNYSVYVSLDVWMINTS